MPNPLGNTTTTDNYSPAVSIGGGALYDSGSLLIANNPVKLRLSTGRSIGELHVIEFPFVSPSTIPLVSGKPSSESGTGKEYIIGVEIASAIAGSPAQVSGWLIQETQAGPTVATAFAQTISPSGKISGGGGAVVTGIIPAAGTTPTAGSGFTYTHPSVGVYVFSYTSPSPFSSTPIVLTTTQGDDRIAIISANSANGFTVRVMTSNDAGGNVQDAAFMFAAFPVV